MVDDLLQFSDRPTTLALAELGDDGVASYRFYVEGTSAPMLTPGPPPESAAAVVTGGLALVLEPMARGVVRMVTEVRSSVLVMVDVNARPAAIHDRDAYLQRLHAVMARADVVKVSHEDLGYLVPRATVHEAATSILDQGARVVLVTGGELDTTIVSHAGACDVAVERAEVVDTIGAGDAFTAGFVTWWLAAGGPLAELSETPCVVAAVQAAHTVAAVVVGRRGADPPTRGDLASDWWPSDPRN